MDERGRADRASQPGRSSGRDPRGAPLRAAAAGFSLLFEAQALVRRRRDLRRLAAVPLLLSVLLVTAALALLAAFSGEIYGLLTGWMPVLEADTWFSWIWIGPARVLLAILGGLLFLLAVAGSVVGAGLVASVVAAPFLDALSQRVELIEVGQLPAPTPLGSGALLAELRRSVLCELQRVVSFALLWGSILAVGLVVPGGQLVAPPMLAVLTILFLPLDYAGHLLDRHGLPFRARRAWLRANLATTAGFGVAAFLTCLVPGLNFLLLPALVAAGTLLAVRHPPPALPAPGPSGS
jgi:CysZ protein